MPPPHLKLYLVAGNAVETPKRLSVGSTNGKVRVLDSGKGDGIVLRQSALLYERLGAQWTPRLRSPIDFDATLFLPYEHLELTNKRTFRDNLLYWLLEEPRAAPPVEERPRPRLAPPRLEATQSK